MRKVISALLVIAAIALGFLGAELHQRDQDEWHRFVVAHHCRAIGQEDAPAGIATAPGKTAWLCDDQLIHLHDTE